MDVLHATWTVTGISENLGTKIFSGNQSSGPIFTRARKADAHVCFSVAVACMQFGRPRLSRAQYYVILIMQLIRT